MARDAFRTADEDSLDRDLQIETSGVIPLWRLSIASPNAPFGVRYQTTDPSVFFNAIKLLPEDISKLSFVDLGSGKGRMLVLAAKAGFKKVMGVEFSPELAAIARRNLGRVGASAEIVELDAGQFSFPDENLVIYMYNPFGGPVMQSIVGNLLDWRRRSKSMAFVVYVNPVRENLFDSCPEFEPVGRTNEARVWKLR